jgi:hypothetical protein
MTGEVVFAAVYATAVVGAALGIDLVGERTARRRPGASDPEASLSWPHTGSLAIHTVVAAVAATAGLLVAGAMAIRHPHASDWLLLTAPSVLAVMALLRLHTRLRAALRPPPPTALRDG